MIRLAIALVVLMALLVGGAILLRTVKVTIVLEAVKDQRETGR